MKRSKPLKRVSVRPERPRDILIMPRISVEQDQDHEHAQNGDAADPVQRHLVKLAPVAPGGLLEHARPLVGNA